jgi:hypothetical protein
MRLSLPILRQGVHQAFPFRPLQTLRGGLSPLRESMSKNHHPNLANYEGFARASRPSSTSIIPPRAFSKSLRKRFGLFLVIEQFSIGSKTIVSWHFAKKMGYSGLQPSGHETLLVSQARCHIPTNTLTLLKRTLSRADPWRLASRAAEDVRCLRIAGVRFALKIVASFAARPCNGC